MVFGVDPFHDLPEPAWQASLNLCIGCCRISSEMVTSLVMAVTDISTQLSAQRCGEVCFSALRSILLSVHEGQN